MSRVRILLSEGSSLSSREIINVLGPAGYELDVMDPDPWCLARFSRWVRTVTRTPPVGRDPLGYLDAVNAQLSKRDYDVLLPTHEQAYLFAKRRERLVREIGIALAAPEAFARVQSKVAFAQLLEQLGIPQPRFHVLNDPSELDAWPYPYWLKASFSTAGQGVRQVRGDGERARALDTLWPSPGGLLVQAPAQGIYGQVQALFDHGRLIAAHTCIATATGMGGSAAARLSVGHAAPRAHAAALGEALMWHGGLTLDYFWDDRDGVGEAGGGGAGGIQFLECNPRTVEPGNAAASGVPLPQMQVALSLGETFDGPPVIGRPGVRTHSLLAISLGAADRSGRRRAVLAQLVAALCRRGVYRGSREILMPIRRDPSCVLPLAFVLARLLTSPASAARIAHGSVAAYSLGPDAVQTLG